MPGLPSVILDMSPTVHGSLECSEDTLDRSSPAFNANSSTETSSKMQDACHIIGMSRTDSGFGEKPNTPDSSLSRASSIIRLEEGKDKVERRRNRFQENTESRRAPKSYSRSCHKESGRSMERNSPTRSTSQWKSSQVKSSRPGSHRSSKTSSRRSSYMNQANTNSKRPPIVKRSTTTTYARRSEDPVALYQRSKSLFESKNVLDYRNHSTTLSDEALASWSVQPFSSISSAPVDDFAFGLLTDEKENSPEVHEYSSPMPATTIDWTLPSTRRREYRKIESCCRGIPGLWRRFAPRFLQGNRRLSFYNNEKDDDAGSVRRYRIGLPENEDEKNKAIVKTAIVRPSLEKVKRTWSCLGSFRKSGRNPEVVS